MVNPAAGIPIPSDRTGPSSSDHDNVEASSSLGRQPLTDIAAFDGGLIKSPAEPFIGTGSNGTPFDHASVSVVDAALAASHGQPEAPPELAGSSRSLAMWPFTSTAVNHGARQGTSGSTSLQLGNLASRHCVVLVMGILRAFPQMMLRRQTFPPFIHGQWHRADIPEELANCMSISQIFVSRTSATRGFLWRVITSEVQMLNERVRRRIPRGIGRSMLSHIQANTYSAQEILTAMQVLLIYKIMLMMDQDEHAGERGADMVDTLKVRRKPPYVLGRLADYQ